MSKDTVKHKKLCFVTIGATASFDELITGTLSPAFLGALRDANYTDLRLQYGKDGKRILQSFEEDSARNGKQDHGLRISGFAFKKDGLDNVMRAAKGEDNASEGVVVSHAGSGSILDALRISVPLIVVPNPTLLDNHQVELAEVLAAQGYVVHGRLNDLPTAIKESEALRLKQKAWPPINSGHDPSGRGLAGIMDDEMGFVD